MGGSQILGWGWRFMSSFRCGFWDGSEIALGWLRAGSRGSNVMVPEVPVWWFRSSGVVVSKLKAVQTRSNIKLKLKWNNHETAQAYHWKLTVVHWLLSNFRTILRSWCYHLGFLNVILFLNQNTPRKPSGVDCYTWMSHESHLKSDMDGNCSKIEMAHNCTAKLQKRVCIQPCKVNGLCTAAVISNHLASIDAYGIQLQLQIFAVGSIHGNATKHKGQRLSWVSLSFKTHSRPNSYAKQTMPSK